MIPMTKTIYLGEYELRADPSGGSKIEVLHVPSGKTFEIEKGNLNLPELQTEAYLGSSQSIAADNNFDKVTVDTITRDDFDAFDTSNNEFVAPRDGKYRIRSTAFVENLGQGNSLRSEIRVNGTTVQRSIGHGALSANVDVPVEDTEELAEGDVVTLHAALNAGSSKNLLSDVFRTNISITRIG